MYGRYLQFTQGILISHIRFVRAFTKTRQITDNLQLYNAYHRIYTEFFNNNDTVGQPLDAKYVDNEIHKYISFSNQVLNIGTIMHKMQSIILDMLQQYFTGYLTSQWCADSSILSVVLHSKRYDTILQCSKIIYMEEFVMYYVECDKWNQRRTQHNIVYGVSNSGSSPSHAQTTTDPTKPVEPPHDPYITHMLLEAKNLFTRFIRAKSEYSLELPDHVSESVVTGWNLARRTHVIEQKLIDGLLHVQQRSLDKIRLNIWPVYVKETLYARQQKSAARQDNKVVPSPVNSAAPPSQTPSPPMSSQQFGRRKSSSSHDTATDLTLNSIAGKPRVINTPRHSMSITNNVPQGSTPALAIVTPTLTPLIVSAAPMSPQSAEASSLQTINVKRDSSGTQSSRTPRRHSLDASDLTRISNMRQMITPPSTGPASSHNSNGNTPPLKSMITPSHSDRQSISITANPADTNKLQAPYQMQRSVSNGLNSDIVDLDNSESDIDDDDQLRPLDLDLLNAHPPTLQRAVSDAPHEWHNSTPVTPTAAPVPDSVQSPKSECSDHFEQYAYSVLSGQIAFQRNLSKLHAADDIDLLYFEKGGRYGSTHKQHNSHLVNFYVNSFVSQVYGEGQPRLVHIIVVPCKPHCCCCAIPYTQTVDQ